jgi:hypothetical protein
MLLLGRCGIVVMYWTVQYIETASLEMGWWLWIQDISGLTPGEVQDGKISDTWG